MATEKKFKLIVNCETGEQTSVEFTAEEYAQAAADAEAYAAAQVEREAAEAAKAEAKADAIAALVALGLTEAQVAALTA